MRNLIFLGMFFLFSGSLKGSDCKELSKIDLYNSAELIFLGQIIDVSDSVYFVRVDEKYKGNLSDTISGMIEERTIHPEIGDVWLIFAKKMENDLIFVDFCSGSKSLRFTLGAHDVSVPIPPPASLVNDSDFFIIENINRSTSLNEFFFDVYSLRYIKDQREKEYTYDKYVTLLNHQNALEVKGNIIIGINLILLVLVGFLGILIGRKIKT